MHFLLENAKRAVIKLGSGVLTTGSGSIDAQRIAGICRQVAILRSQNIQIIIVSSGAIGLGMARLGCKRRPADLTQLQACAAVGQSILIDTWQSGFDPNTQTVAQILLTREDVRSRKRHVAVKNLFEKLLSEGIIPIVNENDSISTEEIRFGENDILSALVASLTKADMLILLSVTPGLLDRKGTGKIVPVVERITPAIEGMAGGTESPTSIGGMRSKIEAAKTALKSGCGVFLGDGKDPGILLHLLRGTARGTFFVPEKISLGSKKRWLAFFENPEGVIRVDGGAARALREDGSSLLAKGITGHEGDFERGAVVSIEGPEGALLGRGISRFGSGEITEIKGRTSEEIRRSFPDRHRVEVVHRDSLVLLG